MSINKQILILSFLLVFVMSFCVYNHIDDFEQTSFEKSELSLVNKELIEEERATEKLDKKQILETAVEKKIEDEELNINVKDDLPVEVSTEDKKVIVEEKVEETPKETTEKVLKSIKKEENIEIVKNETSFEEIQKQIDEIVEEQRVSFKRLSTNITDKSFATVEKISNLLKDNPKIKLEIGGHTDARGKADVNKWVSQQRAKSVRKELIKLGISKERLKAIGYGETKPKVPNDKNGYSVINRRVEFKVIEE